MATESLLKLNHDLTHCERCPRLRTYCTHVAETKKKEFRAWDYWGKPVPGFGDPDARIWIIGLAPAAHGANRTGRMFTGDSSGRWLYRALHGEGFANTPDSVSRQDGLKLTGAYVSSAARCAPPKNRPSPEELKRCAVFLDREWVVLKKVRLLVALGAIGFQAALDLMKRQGIRIPRPRPRFRHAAFTNLGTRAILASYHPSRQNTNTGRLTEEMWSGIFKSAREWVGD